MFFTQMDNILKLLLTFYRRLGVKLLKTIDFKGIFPFCFYDTAMRTVPSQFWPGIHASKFRLTWARSCVPTLYADLNFNTLGLPDYWPSCIFKNPTSVYCIWPSVDGAFLHKCGTCDSCNQYVNCISKKMYCVLLLCIQQMNGCEPPMSHIALMITFGQI